MHNVITGGRGNAMERKWERRNENLSAATRRGDGNRTSKHKKITVSAGLLWHRHVTNPRIMGIGISEKRILILRLREKLRMRLDHLEALAASAAQSRAMNSCAGDIRSCGSSR